MSEAEYSSLVASSASSTQVVIEISTDLMECLLGLDILVGWYQNLLDIVHTYHNPIKYILTLYFS